MIEMCNRHNACDFCKMRDIHSWATTHPKEFAQILVVTPEMNNNVQNLIVQVNEAKLTYPLWVCICSWPKVREIVYEPDELAPALARALAVSPIDEVRVEEVISMMD